MIGQLRKTAAAVSRAEGRQLAALDSEARFRCYVVARGRGDAGEVRRLVASCPQETWRGPAVDFVDRIGDLDLLLGGVVSPAIRSRLATLRYLRLLSALGGHEALPSADRAASGLAALLAGFTAFCEGTLGLPAAEVMAFCCWAPGELAAVGEECDEATVDADEAATWGRFLAQAWRARAGDKAALMDARALVARLSAFQTAGGPE